VHESALDVILTSGRYPDYSEQPAAPVRVAGFEALASDFTFARKAGLFGAIPMAGTRITVLPGDRRVTVFYYYPKAGAATYGPLFRKMTESLKLGSGGG
jgi:hypothetical protein